ncbi:nicotinate-nucleotide--dimethylbenzimidazole phosphoribosyltransferase [Candidatus Poribacteria bacterium]|jgi:nicotinate-nucleotide--dimethylbenzimidazole phosphoribosyltransferase|nr:nicotinate-nucleotide--dimethylbenzimidazole phosphoribosyltransferase [Candidatus Poribacteria bacterium]MBT5531608.1 nicotinate-nucleotide--dimethylbenzimidazole phosphoribosyltransferase [Candidatus Poribacteria bacterium]MBT5714411.1 nicotinate-nucleotide--dimethylbenzimidazole phosphoribosyltransferase [Candidatus Poribacteria bacterium]MBT7097044.1 nicotinate-nucleotide--dimethylbenzimidazole phosphoribosyltransferase [Candidatus Poribacteria bacterium]MBT7803993.1 nicotinate-nucleotid
MDSALLRDTIDSIDAPDHTSAPDTQRRLDNLTKPLGSLGALEGVACRLVTATGHAEPRFREKRVIVFAADHGVAAEGVSAYPSEVTAQMVLNFLAGGAAINVLARHAGAKVVVVDVGVAADMGSPAGLISRKVAPGTRNMRVGPAMDASDALAALEVGIDIAQREIAAGADMIAMGEMGIGNTTAATAVTAAVTGKPVADLTGSGTGIDEDRRALKVQVIEDALALHAPSVDDPVALLASVGGFEVGAIAGATLAAAANRVPVVVDGFISTAGALIAALLCPDAKNAMFASHSSAEPGHAAALEWLGLEPLLRLGLRLGEGTGAALAMPILQAAGLVLGEMASFADAGVSTAEEGQG